MLASHPSAIAAKPASAAPTKNRAAERYLDYAATAPMLPEALEAYARAARDFPGNPSSVHASGAAARRALNEAKERICACVGFDDGRLVLTSGATEANNFILRSVLATGSGERALIGRDTHPSIWFAISEYPEAADVLNLPEGGVLSPAGVTAALTPEHRLVALGHACNETGLVHPVREIATVLNLRGLLTHIDGTQAVGRLPVDLSQIPCDFYTFSAHKFGGPHGVGGVFMRDFQPTPLLRGGNQEWRLRAGTENVAAALATATALEVARARVESEATRLRALAGDLVARLRQAWPETLVNSDVSNGLPGLVSVSFPGVPAHDVAVALSMEDFSVSTGSACHADLVIPSRVILALGRRDEEALGTLRISMGPQTTAQTINDLVEALTRELQAYRKTQ
jgi:cysteine desulfurase